MDTYTQCEDLPHQSTPVLRKHSNISQLCVSVHFCPLGWIRFTTRSLRRTPSLTLVHFSYSACLRVPSPVLEMCFDFLFLQDLFLRTRASVNLADLERTNTISDHSATVTFFHDSEMIYRKLSVHRSVFVGLQSLPPLTVFFQCRKDLLSRERVPSIALSRLFSWQARVRTKSLFSEPTCAG